MGNIYKGTIAGIEGNTARVLPPTPEPNRPLRS